MSQVLPGQRLREADFEPVEVGLHRFITDLIFRPLAQIWREEVGRRLDYENSAASDRTSLLKALRAGRLQYSVDAKGRGIFSGAASAALGRALRALGATFDVRERVYRLKPEQVPTEILTAGAAHAEACARAHQRMEQFLVGVQGQVDQAVARLDPMALQSGTAVQRVAAGFNDSIKRVGIPFERPTAAARARMSADYTENMKLWIRKWAADDVVRLRHQVEDNARSGARASTLAARISSRYEVSQSKARFLARQETGLFMSQYHKEQFVSAGVPRYVWDTSKDEDVRVGHQDLHGRVFSWASGAPAKYMSNGKNNNPHEDFNCLPEDGRVDFAYGVKKAFRRFYSGPLTELILDGSVFRATPNHPVLTPNGWRPVGSLHPGDKVLQTAEQFWRSPEGQDQQGVASIREAFEALGEEFARRTAHGHADQFHGDGSDYNIDVVDIAGNLRFNGKIPGAQKIGQLDLSVADASHLRFGTLERNLSTLFFRDGRRRRMGSSRQRPSFLETHSGETDNVRLASRARAHTIVDEDAADYVSGNSVMTRDRQFAVAARVHGAEIGSGKVHLIMGRPTANWNPESFLAQAVGQVIGTPADRLGRVLEQSPSFYHEARILDVRVRNFKGHVYNLETERNWYIAGGIIQRNCRCVARPLIDTAYNAKFKIGDVYTKES